MLYDLGDVTPHLTPSETDQIRGRNFRCPSSVFVVSPHPETDQLIDQLTTHDRKRAISKEKSNFPRPAPLKLLFKCGRDNAGVRRATPHVRCGASLLARRARATSRTDLVRTCAHPTSIQAVPFATLVPHFCDGHRFVALANAGAAQVRRPGWARAAECAPPRALRDR